MWQYNQQQQQQQQKRYTFFLFDENRQKRMEICVVCSNWYGRIKKVPKIHVNIYFDVFVTLLSICNSKTRQKKISKKKKNL